jgi:hypothetical protein
MLRKARSDVALAKTATQLRVAQAVLIPLELGITLAETAKIIGRSASWIASQRTSYIKAQGVVKRPKSNPKGGRRNQILLEQDEYDFIMQACVDCAAERRRGFAYGDGNGKPAFTVAKHLQMGIERHVGRPVASSTIYKLMDRAARKAFVNGSSSDWEAITQILRWNF